MKKFLAFIMLAVMSAVSYGGLTAGDLAVVEFQTDTDQVKVVALTDIEAGEVIYFTDNGWTSSGTFRSNEGIRSYTVSAGGLSAGTVVDLIADSQSVKGSFSLSASGDQVLIYQGTADIPTNFIYAANDDGQDGDWQSNASSSNTSAIPTGLVA